MFPHVLVVLFIKLAQSSTKYVTSKIVHYEDYVAVPFQVIGILTFCFTAVILLGRVINQKLYYLLDTYEEIPRNTENNIWRWVNFDICGSATCTHDSTHLQYWKTRSLQLYSFIHLWDSYLPYHLFSQKDQSNVRPDARASVLSFCSFWN